jgi:hypothetical protein
MLCVAAQGDNADTDEGGGGGSAPLAPELVAELVDAMAGRCAALRCGGAQRKAGVSTC